MVGGAVMRAAAKVAWFGIRCGLRGPTVTLLDLAVSAAARTVTRTIAGGLVSSTEDGKSGVVLSSLYNSAVQSVVAALAADKNVLDAVMQNEEVMEFLKQQQTSVPSTYGNKFMDFIDNVKAKVAKDTDVSEFFQNIFGGPTEGNIKLDGNGNATANMTMGASFMARAILSIMVVILKRG